MSNIFKEMTLRFFLAAAALSLVSWASLAQNGKISGTVQDASSGHPVEFATVALNDPATNKPVDGTVCDDKGKFVINKIATGNYKLVISFIGYETYSQDIAITERRNSIELETIKLSHLDENLSCRRYL